MDNKIFVFILHPGEAKLLANCLHKSNFKQSFCTSWRIAVAVDHLVKHIVCVLGRGDKRDFFIHFHSACLGGNVAIGNVGTDLHINKGLCSFLFGFAAFFKHRLVQQFNIQIVANTVDISVLFCTEKVSCSADFQVTKGDFKAGTELGIFLDSREAFFSHLGQCLSGTVGKVCICLSFASANSAPDLMKLRKTETVGIFNNKSICGRQVNACLNYGCADKNVNISSHKHSPDVLQLVFIHPAVSNRHTCGGHIVGNSVCDKVN